MNARRIMTPTKTSICQNRVQISAEWADGVGMPLVVNSLPVPETSDLDFAAWRCCAKTDHQRMRLDSPLDSNCSSSRIPKYGLGGQKVGPPIGEEDR